MNNSRPRTLVDLLKGATRARADQEVIRYKQDKQWTGLSGQTLFDRVRHVALGLYDFGIRKGDRVAILAESGPLWSISDYVILSNGAVNVACGGFDDLGQNFACSGIDGVKVSCAFAPLIVDEQAARRDFRFGGG